MLASFIPVVPAIFSSEKIQARIRTQFDYALVLAFSISCYLFCDHFSAVCFISGSERSHFPPLC